MCSAEWLHSPVHGRPGESPGGGTLPSGEQRQPEYGHWGTVQVCYCVYICKSCVHLTTATVCLHAFSSVICGLYICCTNHLHLLLSVSSRFSFTVLSLCPFCLTFSLCLPLCLHTVLFCLSLLLLPSSLLISSWGTSRAPLIGSVWWRRQSDLEWVTDEVRSARCLSSTFCCCRCYCPDLRCWACGTHTYQSPHVHTHKARAHKEIKLMELME